MKIIISGSSSGIGCAIAKRFLLLEHQVIGLARNHNKFMPSHQNYINYTIDLSRISALESQFKKIYAQHQNINAVICSAGYGHFVELEQFSFQYMQEMMNVNFLSQALLIKTFLPILKRQSNSKIIVIGSECALEGQKKGTIYCASKFAWRGFCQSLRKECMKTNVAVSLINPGMVDTPFFERLSFHPGDKKNNVIQSHQIAEVVVLLMNMDNNCVVEEINLQPMQKIITKNNSTTHKREETEGDICVLK